MLDATLDSTAKSAVTSTVETTGEGLLAAIDRSLDLALSTGTQPPQLRAALRAAVFPGGARLRPQLCLAVAAACGAPNFQMALPAATAVELLHCASLVHDDLPCFDNAPWRRGHPSVHRQFGEALAVLAGDGLIVNAFAVLARAISQAPGPGAAINAELAHAALLLVGGQGWEAEPQIDLLNYHHGKTVALFEAATVSGALAAHGDPNAWRLLGRTLGQAYQLADDLADLDHDLPQHNLAHTQGPAAARARLGQVLEAAQAAVPQGAPALDAWFVGLHRQLRPLI